MQKNYLQLISEGKGTAISLLSPLTSAKKVGETVPYMSSIVSAERPSEDLTEIKINALAIAIDEIVVKRSVKASKMPTTGMVVVNYSPASGNGSKVKFNGTEFVFSGEYNSIAANIALFVYNVSSSVELQSALSSILEAQKPTTTGKPAKLRSVYKVCDYFAHIDNAASLEYEIIEKSLKDSEIQRAIDAGTLSALEVEGIPPIRSVVKSAAKSTSNMNSPKSILKRAINGEFKIPFTFNEKVSCYIPKIEFLNGFVPTRAFVKLLGVTYNVLNSALNSVDLGAEFESQLKNFLLFGDPAGGKTYTWKAVCAALQVPYLSVAGNKFTEDDTVEGKDKPIAGVITCVETPFLLAFKYGGIVALEEINLWNPNVAMGCLGQAIEGPETVQEDGYINVKRHPLCIVGANLNIGTAGTSDLNEALQTRFRTAIEVACPEERQLIQIITKGHSGKEKEAKYIYDFYKLVVDWLKSDEIGAEDIAMVVSLRSCQGAMELYCTPGNIYSLKEAMRDSIVNQAIMRNPELRPALLGILGSYKDFDESSIVVEIDDED